MDLISIKKPLFGKEVEFFLPDMDKTLITPVVEAAYDEGLWLSKIFKLYDEKSELSQLNKKRELNVSKEFLEVLKRSLEMCKETGGAYDVSLGRLFLARKRKENEPRLSCSFKDIEIKKNIVKLTHKDVLIDLGSIAKGYIADKMADYIREQGIEAGVVNARGDIVVFGDEPLLIGIQNPRKKEELMGKIRLLDESIATSGDYNQFNKDYKKSHIINSKDAISVSVVAKTLLEAEVYSTALFVVDKKSRQKLLSKNKSIKALVIDNNMNAEFYNGFKMI